MDDFSQTGGRQEDLFDDLEEVMQTRSQDDLFSDDLVPIMEAPAPIPAHTQATPVKNAASPTQAARRQDGRRTNGKGRGSAPGQTDSRKPIANASSNIKGNGIQNDGSESATDTVKEIPKDTATSPPQRVIKLESRHAPASLEASAGTTASIAATTSTVPVTPTAPSAQASQTAPLAPSAQTAPTAPTEPKAAPKPQPVRGNRSGTGGPTRQKLTEEELAAKMQAARLKNANLEAAHARAEADAASFAQRENTAALRRQEERRDRQQMMGEREKNRQRKLKAQGIREWDSEKVEEADHSTKDQRRVYNRGRGGHNNGQSRDLFQRTDAPKSKVQPQSEAESFPALTSSKPAASQEDASARPQLSFPGKKANGAVADLKDISGEAKASSSWADMVEESKPASKA